MWQYYWAWLIDEIKLSPQEAYDISLVELDVLLSYKSNQAIQSDPKKKNIPSAEQENMLKLLVARRESKRTNE